MRKFDLVLFDLGNVLVSIDVANMWEALRLSPPERERLQGPLMTLAHRYESGQIPTVQFLSEAAAALAHKSPMDQIVEAMNAIIGTPLESMERIVREVSVTHRTGLLSNTNELHYLKSVETVPALRYVREVYLSYQLKLMKPDPEIFRKVSQNSRVPPEKIFFTDDLEENVRSARQAGFHAVRFDSAKMLEEVLFEYGILSAGSPN